MKLDLHKEETRTFDDHRTGRCVVVEKIVTGSLLILWAGVLGGGTYSKIGVIAKDSQIARYAEHVKYFVDGLAFRGLED